MGVTATSLTALIERELSALNDPRVINHIRGLLIPPEPQMRPWDYGTPGEAYPCWLVLAGRIIKCRHSLLRIRFRALRAMGLILFGVNICRWNGLGLV